MKLLPSLFVLSALTSTLLITACAAAPTTEAGPLVAPAAAPTETPAAPKVPDLNGSWTMMKLDCTHGRLAHEGRSISQIIDLGMATKNITISEGGKVISQIRYARFAESPTSFCDINLQETWNLKADGTLEISDVKSVKVAKSKQRCPGSFDQKKARTFKYDMEGDKLRVIYVDAAYDPFHGRKVKPEQFCSGGEEVEIYRRTDAQ